MPDLHDIMNIVADAKDNDEGRYPRMPSVNTIIGPEVKWVDHGRYHHAKDTGPGGFSWKYDGAEMDRWWSMRKPGKKWVANIGPYGGGYYTLHDWDYAGYTMVAGLWGAERIKDGADADDVQTPFLTALNKLSQVIPNSLGKLESGKSDNFHWSPTSKLIADLVRLETMFEDYGEGRDSNGYLLTAFKNLDIPEGPMTGAAASVFGAKIYHLFLRFQEMESQVRNNHRAISNIHEKLVGPARDLRESVRAVMNDPSATMRGVLNQWYHHESNGRQIWNHDTGQFWIRIKKGVYGPVSNPVTDENVNNRLKEIWKNKFSDVISNAELLYKTLNDVYESAHRSFQVIEEPAGGAPISMISDIDDEDPPGGSGPDPDDFPDEITLKWDPDGPPFGGATTRTATTSRTRSPTSGKATALPSAEGTTRTATTSRTG